MGKRVTSLLISFFACLLFLNSAKADVSDVETYTVTIPEAVTVVLTAGATNFGAITSAQFGVGDTALHNILVGNGVVATSSSYITTNGTAATGARQFTLTFAPDSDETCTISDGGTYGILTLNDASASVQIRLYNAGKTDYPELGDPVGTPVAFAVLGNTLNIAAASGVPFDAATKKAPLSMLMDLDETSLSVADGGGDLSFDMTLTVVGVN